MTTKASGAGTVPSFGADDVDVHAVTDYLDAHGLLPDDATISAERLTGGVSAEVVAVRIQAADGTRNWVIKRALPQLRVASTWVATPQRAIVEARAMDVGAHVLPGQVPDVVYVDPVAFVTIQQRADPALTDWRASLLGGATAKDVETARALGTALATLHAATVDRDNVVGDDLFTTNSDRLERGVDMGVANAILVKPNQIGTVSEAHAVVAQAREAGYATVLSARSGETEDAWLADLAVGWRTGQIKVGSLTRSERTAKWNRLLRLAAELGDGAGFAGRQALR